MERLLKIMVLICWLMLTATLFAQQRLPEAGNPAPKDVATGNGVAALIQKGTAALEKGDTITASRTLEAAASEASRLKIHALQGDALLAYYGTTGNASEQGITVLNKAIEAYARSKSVAQIGKTHLLLSCCYTELNKEHLALEAAQKGLEAYQQSHYKPGLQEAYTVLSGCYLVAGSFDETIRYGIRAVAIGEIKGAGDIMAQACFNLGRAYFYTAYYEKGLDYMQQALDIRKKLKDNEQVNEVSMGMAVAMEAMGKTEEALRFFSSITSNYPSQRLQTRLLAKLVLVNLHATLGHAREGTVLCNQLESAITLHGKTIGPIFCFELYNAITDFYIRIGDVSRATRYFNAMQKAITEPGASSIISQSNLLLCSYSIDTLRGDFHAAIPKFQRYTILRDSITQISKNQLIAEMNVKYDVEKKDNDLRDREKDLRMLTREKQLRAAQIKRNSLVRIIIIGVSLLVLSIIGLLIGAYRIRLRTAKALKTKQQEIEQKNHQLQGLADEKQWLLQEIHHRVKNNLQIIMSLLNSQSSFLDDDVALSAIRNSQHRVHSMALIHQKLYTSDASSTINMESYVQELMLYLKDSFDTGNRLRFEVDVEPIDMDVSQAIPIGLILNEAVTNSIKYAFPEGKGMISVSLQPDEGDYFMLRIADDGVGFPEEFDITNAQSLGMRLIRGLSRDLEGNFKVSGEKGTVIEIAFIYKYKTKHQTFET